MTKSKTSKFVKMTPKQIRDDMDFMLFVLSGLCIVLSVYLITNPFPKVSDAKSAPVVKTTTK